LNAGPNDAQHFRQLRACRQLLFRKGLTSSGGSQRKPCFRAGSQRACCLADTCNLDSYGSALEMAVGNGVCKPVLPCSYRTNSTYGQGHQSECSRKCIGLLTTASKPALANVRACASWYHVLQMQQWCSVSTGSCYQRQTKYTTNRMVRRADSRARVYGWCCHALTACSPHDTQFNRRGTHSLCSCVKAAIDAGIVPVN
jgi:hypothetical protein